MKLTEKIANYYKEHGLRGVALRTMEKVTGIRPGAISYEKWMRDMEPDEEELQRQRGCVFSKNYCFSIVVPLYRTKEEYLRALIQSVEEQTYGNWELCLSDGSGAESPLTSLLKEYQKRSPKIKVCQSENPLGISENTNRAIGMAEGDFLVFADHDDLLAPNALYECARSLAGEELQILYSDEDKISMEGGRRYDPQFKPDFSPELLCSMNYICHLFVVERQFAAEVGALDPAFDGAQDYDFIFRCTERTERIGHIRKVLYHWRCHEDSTAENQESKAYAFEAGKRAVEAHLERCGQRGRVEHGACLGLYRTIYEVEGEPLLTILIPNKDHIEELRRCVISLFEKSSYRNFEILIVENNSREEETFAFYEAIQKEHSNVEVVTYTGHFNYSAINNFGADYAKGEYLLFLNNDTELLEENSLTEMLGLCGREEVGAVGARLFYGDGTVQHAGVIIGLGGIAGHAFAGERKTATGYCRRIICNQNVSAVTAACMMVKRRDFERVKGFDEKLEVAFNDVDFCLRLRELGKGVIYAPYVQFVHYESKSRGAEDTKEKVERFQREIGRFADRWDRILTEGDPYYNPNLSLMGKAYTLKDRKRDIRPTYENEKEKVREEDD